MFIHGFKHKSKFIRSAGTACMLVLMHAGLVGCQSGQSQRDAFNDGADRPPTPRTLHMMARLLNENGRTDQAEYVLLKIIDENPLYLPGYVELADLQIRRQRYAPAIETLTAAHTLAPADPVIANNLGVLHLRGRQYAEASGAFDAAVAADPQEARYRANLALSLGMQGAYHEAYEVYTSVVTPSEAFWNIGVISEARQDMERASAFFNQSHRLAKGDAEPGFGEFGGQATVSVPVD